VAISKMLVIGSIHRNELFLLVSAITQQVKGLRTGRTLPSTRLTRDCLGHYEIGRFVDGRILVAPLLISARRHCQSTMTRRLLRLFEISSPSPRTALMVPPNLPESVDPALSR